MNVSAPKKWKRSAVTLLVGVVCTVLSSWLLTFMRLPMGRLGPSYICDDATTVWEVRRANSVIGFSASRWDPYAMWLQGATQEQRESLIAYATRNDPEVLKFPVFRRWPAWEREPYLESARRNGTGFMHHTPTNVTVPEEFRSFAVPAAGFSFVVRRWGVPFPSLWCASEMIGGRWSHDAGSIGISAIRRPMFSSVGPEREVRLPLYVDWPLFAANVGIYGALWAFAAYVAPVAWRKFRAGRALRRRSEPKQ